MNIPCLYFYNTLLFYLSNSMNCSILFVNDPDKETRIKKQTGQALAAICWENDTRYSEAVCNLSINLKNDCLIGNITRAIETASRQVLLLLLRASKPDFMKIYQVKTGYADN
jgi:hypothetical protein